jgi:hypothetical protein
MPAINTTFNVWGPLVTQARAALLNHLVVWSPMVEDFADLNPRAKLFTISESEVEHTGNIAHKAIEAGRFLDFAFSISDIYPTRSSSKAANVAGLYGKGALSTRLFVSLGCSCTLGMERAATTPPPCISSIQAVPALSRFVSFSL